MVSKFMEEIKSESKKYGGGASNSDFFKFEKGVSRIRIAAQPKIIAYHFFGEGQKPDVCVGIDEGCPHHKEGTKRPTIKLCTYVVDRADGLVKFAELPLSISYAINDLQQDQDFSFEDFPMPFDVKITYEPKNPDPKAKYRLVASPKQEKLTDEEEAALAAALAKMSPEKYVQIRKDKQLSQGKPKPDYPEDPSPDYITF